MSPGGTRSLLERGEHLLGLGEVGAGRGFLERVDAGVEHAGALDAASDHDPSEDQSDQLQDRCALTRADVQSERGRECDRGGQDRQDRRGRVVEVLLQLRPHGRDRNRLDGRG
jgi:hypothetical protein